MRALVLGNSSFVKRRVLRAMHDVPAIEAIDVASRRGDFPDGDKIGAAFRDFDTALESSAAELVYISTATGEHETWIDRTLRSGRHVIVDKPAVLSFEAGQKLVEMADGRGLCLAEATVFLDHPLFRTAREAIVGAQRISRVVVIFSMPPLAADNFRYDAQRGGGAINDLGPYLAASGRFFFASQPLSVAVMVLARRAGADTAFSALCDYGEGRCLVGAFGYDTEYRNQLQAFGPGIALTAGRAFSPPPDFEAVLEVTRADAVECVPIGRSDCMAIMIERVVQSIPSRAFARFYSAMVDDAETLDRLRCAAGDAS